MADKSSSNPLTADLDLASRQNRSSEGRWDCTTVWRPQYERNAYFMAGQRVPFRPNLETATLSAAADIAATSSSCLWISSGVRFAILAAPCLLASQQASVTKVGALSELTQRQAITNNECIHICTIPGRSKCLFLKCISQPFNQSHDNQQKKL